MQTCVDCSAPLRDEAKFCTRCGAAVFAPSSVVDALPVLSMVYHPEPATGLDPEPVLEIQSEAVPARIPPQRRTARPLVRSTAATWALVTGIAPLVLSVIGNLISSQLGVAALTQVEAGESQGAWAPVLTVLALVFVGNAVLLTVCGITGVRGVRETANGITRGRGLAIAGLAAGGVNLVLWVAGLVVTVSGLNVVLG